ncbi:sensor histidine kinase [Marinomonas polaris]|jgi:signal transduction histidine kinase|uniref:sensor histidine kinase n=1 Tax=Marinomonas TaxID=28253 RepID=UPI000C1ECDAB|nr:MULTISPECIES: ATP-binding protein [unclassified Marinomonas]PJE57131.1 histidine kinase [Marinomonas sp. BSi20584]|tara:strand:- start:78 stop:1385 length:1308 start_codon:yes stop_codon:yes gene_type:complete
MKNTFLRVFLVVLLSNIVVVSIGLAMVQFIQKRNQVSADLLGDVGVQLVAGYEKFGITSLQEETKKAEKRLSGTIYLYQENGRPLLKPLPRNFKEQNTPSVTTRPAADFLHSQFIQVIGGNNVQYLLIFKPNPEISSLAPEAVVGFSLLGLFVSSGVLAYWLLGPLLKLQRVARSFGQGDMTARVENKLARRSDAVGKLAREFNEMAVRIDTLLSSKERLMRDVSHELRTPLARIEVALTIAEDKYATEAQKGYLSRIRTELHELDELIGQVLTLSRLEAASLIKEEMDLQEWLSEIVADVSFESQLKGISVSKIGRAPKTILGDPLQLRHAIENVLRNACFYAGCNGVIEVETQEKAGTAFIYVRDNGPGVSDDKLEKIFHAFYRSSEAREANSGGFGVGLTISQRIIRAHKGQIMARNREEGGLEVCFQLPIA